MEATNNSSMSFQKTVVIIAIIILIITLTVIGYMMYSANMSNPPGTINKCPDKWTFDTGNNVCKSVIGNPPYTYSNAGHFITDMSCAWRDVSNGAHGTCFGTKNGSATTWNDVSNNWTFGNTTNGKSLDRIYLLADASYNIYDSTYYYHSTFDLSYQLLYTPQDSLEKNRDWAQTYGIAWDGLN